MREIPTECSRIRRLALGLFRQQQRNVLIQLSDKLRQRPDPYTDHDVCLEYDIMTFEKAILDIAEKPDLEDNDLAQFPSSRPRSRTRTLGGVA